MQRIIAVALVAAVAIAAIFGWYGGWDISQLEAALSYEQEHANRKGALAALESALAAVKESS